MTIPMYSRRLIPVFAALLLVLAILACDDDTQSPAGAAYDFSDADSATVTLNVQGFFEEFGELTTEWVEIENSLDGCVVTGDPAVLSAVYYNSTSITGTTDSIHVRFDPDSGDIEYVNAFYSYGCPAGSEIRIVKAYDVPMTSYESTDSTWTAVWRVEADAVCTALDTVVVNHMTLGGDLAYWTCMGSETPSLEIRVTN